MENNTSTQNMEDKQENKKVSASVIIVVVTALLLGIGTYFYVSNNKSGSPVNVNTGDKSNNDIEKTYTLSEISTNNTKESCWTAIDGNVYDLTDFISKHKGRDKILAVCGIDGSDLFSGKDPMGRVHGDLAKMILSKMKIGTLQN